MLTWGDFKRLVDKQVAEANGDDELVAHIDWNGLEQPIVVFEQDRKEGPFVYVN